MHEFFNKHSRTGNNKSEIRRTEEGKRGVSMESTVTDTKKEVPTASHSLPNQNAVLNNIIYYFTRNKKFTKKFN